MPLMARQSDSNLPPLPLIPAGATQGVCVAVIDLGTHESEWQGQTRKRHLVAITWELPEERLTGKDGDYPRTITKKYTLSLSEKAQLHADLTSWRGKAFTQEELDGFDLVKLLGVNAILNIVHQPSKRDASKTYANVASVSPLMKNMQKAKPEGETVYYSLQEQGRAIPGSMPEWLVKIITASEEYLAMTHAGSVIDEPEPEPEPMDEIPF